MKSHEKERTRSRRGLAFLSIGVLTCTSLPIAGLTMAQADDGSDSAPIVQAQAVDSVMPYATESENLISFVGAKGSKVAPIVGSDNLKVTISKVGTAVLVNPAGKSSAVKASGLAKAWKNLGSEPRGVLNGRTKDGDLVSIPATFGTPKVKKSTVTITANPKAGSVPADLLEKGMLAGVSSIAKESAKGKFASLSVSAEAAKSRMWHVGDATNAARVLKSGSGLALKIGTAIANGPDVGVGVQPSGEAAKISYQRLAAKQELVMKGAAPRVVVSGIGKKGKPFSFSAGLEGFDRNPATSNLTIRTGAPSSASAAKNLASAKGLYVLTSISNPGNVDSYVVATGDGYAAGTGGRFAGSQQYVWGGLLGEGGNAIYRDGDNAAEESAPGFCAIADLACTGVKPIRQEDVQFTGGKFTDKEDAQFSNYTYDLKRVYEPDSIDNKCFRSYTAPGRLLAERLAAQNPNVKFVNLACSGAKIKNVELGGKGQNGSQTQAAQLREIADWVHVSHVTNTMGAEDFIFDSYFQCFLAVGMRLLSVFDGDVTDVTAAAASMMPQLYQSKIINADYDPADGCEENRQAELNDRLKELQKDYPAALNDLKKVAPQANIIAMNYPNTMTNPEGQSVNRQVVNSTYSGAIRTGFFRLSELGPPNWKDWAKLEEDLNSGTAVANTDEEFLNLLKDRNLNIKDLQLGIGGDYSTTTGQKAGQQNPYFTGHSKSSWATGGAFKDGEGIWVGKLEDGSIGQCPREDGKTYGYDRSKCRPVPQDKLTAPSTGPTNVVGVFPTPLVAGSGATCTTAQLTPPNGACVKVAQVKWTPDPLQHPNTTFKVTATEENPADPDNPEIKSVRSGIWAGAVIQNRYNSAYIGGLNPAKTYSFTVEPVAVGLGKGCVVAGGAVYATKPDGEVANQGTDDPSFWRRECGGYLDNMLTIPDWLAAPVATANLIDGPDQVWMSNIMLPTIDQTMYTLAKSVGVSALDLRESFNGHELNNAFTLRSEKADGRIADVKVGSCALVNEDDAPLLNWACQVPTAVSGVAVKTFGETAELTVNSASNRRIEFVNSPATGTGLPIICNGEPINGAYLAYNGKLPMTQQSNAELPDKAANVCIGEPGISVLGYTGPGPEAWMPNAAGQMAQAECLVSFVEGASGDSCVRSIGDGYDWAADRCETYADANPGLPKPCRGVTFANHFWERYVTGDDSLCLNGTPKAPSAYADQVKVFTWETTACKSDKPADPKWSQQWKDIYETKVLIEGGYAPPGGNTPRHMTLRPRP